MPTPKLSETDERFNEIVRAYIRGADWIRQNPDDAVYLDKAARDYADKVTSAQPKTR